MASQNLSEEEKNTLRADYEQTNGQIRMLTDIRFRLLTLIPTGTIIAVSVLGTAVWMETALAVGFLGFVFVFAITMYDLRNSQIYDACLIRAEQLENQLQILNGGLYTNRPHRDVKLFGVLVWHDRALAFIYGTTLGGWFYLIIYSLLNLTYSLLNPNATDPKLALDKYHILIYVASTLFSILVACAFIWHLHQIEATRTGQRKLTICDIKKSQELGGNYVVTVKVCLENRWVHAFRYNISELKLLDKNGRKHKNERQTSSFLKAEPSKEGKEDHAIKGKLRPKDEPILGFIAYQLPKGSKPEALIYTPRPWFLNVQQIKYFTKNIVLIRHGNKDTELYPSFQNDDKRPLSAKGKDEISCLQRLLADQCLGPEIYLTSPYEHARETANLLAGKKPVYPVTLLAPAAMTGANIFQAIIDRAEQVAQKKLELDCKTTIAIVGHEPELLKILDALTSSRVQRIKHGQAVWVRADRFSDFLVGKGVIHSQIPGDKELGGQGGQEGSEGRF